MSIWAVCFLAAAVLTPAIGFGGTTAVFSLLNGVVLKPLPCLGPGELVLLIAVSASLVPARRAASANLSSLLRME